MAYRELRDGDLVRVVDTHSSLHGMDVVVIDAQETYARVQYPYGDTTRCYDIPNKNLLVRNSEYYFIVDGRIDHEAKHQHDENLRAAWNKRNIVDSEPECPYNDWSRQDLIDHINWLEDKACNN